MSRATLTYVGFALALVVGLWGVLSTGRTLQVPPDIAGNWQSEGEPARTFHVSQSGRYVRVAERQAPPRTYTLEPAEDGVTTLRDDGGRTLVLRPPSDGDELELVRETDRITLRRGPPGDHAAPPAAALTQHDAHPLFTLLLQLVVILVTCRLVGLAFVHIGQPQVMGEMVAGILLGPSLFGLVAPGAAAWVFPPQSVVYLNILAQVGVVFFLFLIGLELDPRLLRNRGHAAMVISHASIMAPFLLGALLTLWLYPRLFHAADTMRFTPVALFMGAAMSITAFPVLARILTERNLHKTKVGAVAITCAAFDDVTAWCMLAAVVGVARAEGLSSGLITAALAAAYVAAMFLLVRPLLRRLEQLFDAQGRLSQTVIAAIVILVVASACVTEWIGIHALFGAFLMGAIMPKDTRFVRTLSEKLEDYTVVFLLPVFFAYTGLQTQIGLIDSAELWLVTLVIIGVACLGKFGGSTLAALSCGLPLRESGAIGILMNTRGLMELVILNIGRELGVISDAVFVMMVLMALVTTFLTTPVLNLIYPDRLLRRERATTGPPAPGTRSVLIPVSLPKSGRPLLRLADAISGPPGVPRRITALYLRRDAEHEAYSADEQELDPRSIEALSPLLEEAHLRGVEVEPLSFVARDVASGIGRAAAETRADVVLMGFHKPVIGNAMLGGTVHHVLSDAGADVAVFVDRGLHDIRNVLVPYMGGGHDQFALALADTIARHRNAAVTVLHVVPPKDAGERKELGARAATERAFNEPGKKAPVTLKVVESPSPVDVVLDESPRYDLVIIGVSETWGLESQAFGWRPERIARDCPTSLLIVRKGKGHADASPQTPEPVTPAVTPPQPA